jgi:hypothetical protein
VMPQFGASLTAVNYVYVYVKHNTIVNEDASVVSK